MRLIDADRMKRNIVDDGGHETAAELRTWVENQNTIDAIPVEWLENKRENLILAAMVHSTVYGDNSIELCRAVNVVLTMWEKEQEART